MQREDVSSSCIVTCQQQKAAITIFETTFGSLNQMSNRTRSTFSFLSFDWEVFTDPGM